MRIPAAIATLGLLTLTAPTFAQQSPAPAPATAPQGVPVRDNGLVATWYPPAGGKPGPAILVLGGSEGGDRGANRVAGVLAAQGYGVLALAWFKSEGLPQQLQDIPLEYFGAAIHWMRANPRVDRAKIGLYGISKGGEAALLVAARQSEIKAVVAAVPSSVIWQGINFANYADVKSSWSVNGKPLPFLAYDMRKPFVSVFDLYQRSLPAAAEHPDVVIPVERIAGPVLLLSGKGDTLWPSSAMADQVMARLDGTGFKFPHSHIAYPDAGHGAFSPAGATLDNSGYRNMGGTEAGNGFARSDSWARIIAFFRTSLGAPK